MTMNFGVYHTCACTRDCFTKTKNEQLMKYWGSSSTQLWSHYSLQNIAHLTWPWRWLKASPGITGEENQNEEVENWKGRKMINKLAKGKNWSRRELERKSVTERGRCLKIINSTCNLVKSPKVNPSKSLLSNLATLVCRKPHSFQLQPSVLYGYFLHHWVQPAIKLWSTWWLALWEMTYTSLTILDWYYFVKLFIWYTRIWSAC